MDLQKILASVVDDGVRVKDGDNVIPVEGGLSDSSINVREKFFCGRFVTYATNILNIVSDR